MCGAPLQHTFVDLGMSPLANSLLTSDGINAMEPFYPLRVLVCERCFLVQLEEFETPEVMFSNYPYFSSFSTSWLEHSRRYVGHITERFPLDASSLVVEVGSNDGYLLQYLTERGISVLGVEPAETVAKVAIQKGIPTLVKFFGAETARSLVPESAADLLIANNVLAHVPALNDFVQGMKILLRGGGLITIEFPHLLSLIERNQFDTIYHEHFSYFSFGTACGIFRKHGLRLFDVEELPTHGGSLRVYGCHEDDGSKSDSERKQSVLRRERIAGCDSLELYTGFAHRVQEAKREILDFLIDVKRRGLTLAGYGAPAKGNTLLNYCGIGTDFLDYTVDVSPYKQSHFLPGTHLPVKAPETLRQTRPDVVLILPWNLTTEIVEQHSYIRDWGGRFATFWPEPSFLT